MSWCSFVLQKEWVCKTFCSCFFKAGPKDNQLAQFGKKANAEMDIVELVKLLRVARLQLQAQTTVNERAMVRFADEYTIHANGVSDAEDDGCIDDGRDEHNPAAISIKNLSKIKANGVKDFNTTYVDSQDVAEVQHEPLGEALFKKIYHPKQD